MESSKLMNIFYFSHIFSHSSFPSFGILLLLLKLPINTSIHSTILLAVAAINLISSFKTSNAKADAYTYHYSQYQSSISILFPGSHSKPNHHYAMHNGALMKYWGPLPSLSEFPGERMNGMLQNINTNRQLSMLSILY